MQVPRFWKKASAKVQGSHGKPWTLPRWGWSSSSESEAASMADQRASETERRWAGGQPKGDNAYQAGFYDDLPPREEIIDEITDASNQTIAIVSRNSYGSLVLNTDRMLMIDVDLPHRPSPGAGIVGSIMQMFASKPAAKAAGPENEIPENIRSPLNNSRNSFRVYKTAAGWRLIMTDPAIDGLSNMALEIMQQFPVDPQYMKLCKRQKTCRARLTPKSWRVGLDRLRVRFPYTSEKEQAVMDSWSKKYLKAIEGHATCRLVLGHNAPVAAELLPLVELHDQLSGVDSESPLA